MKIHQAKIKAIILYRLFTENSRVITRKDPKKSGASEKNRAEETAAVRFGGFRRAGGGYMPSLQGLIRPGIPLWLQNVSAMVARFEQKSMDAFSP